MNRPVLVATLSLPLLAACGCTTRLGEERRLLREREANQKTVEKHGWLKIEGARKTESFGTRSTDETSASISITSNSK